jgi:hypothetical protein
VRRDDRGDRGGSGDRIQEHGHDRSQTAAVANSTLYNPRNKESGRESASRRESVSREGAWRADRGDTPSTTSKSNLFQSLMSG